MGLVSFEAPLLNAIQIHCGFSHIAVHRNGGNASGQFVRGLLSAELQRSQHVESGINNCLQPLRSCVEYFLNVF